MIKFGAQIQWEAVPPKGQNESAWTLLACRHLLFLSLNDDTHFTVPQRVEGWVDCLLSDSWSHYLRLVESACRTRVVWLRRQHLLFLVLIYRPMTATIHQLAQQHRR